MTNGAETVETLGVRSTSFYQRNDQTARMRLAVGGVREASTAFEHSMTPNFARHEQFLRIYALLDILVEARQPLDDQTLIDAIRERLGLSQLSPRTLRRDCEFLTSCGYPVDHKPINGDRKFGWQLSKQVGGGRKIPAEPITLLELVAFMVGRDLLRGFEGTVLWTGIESLRHKIERDVPASLLELLENARQVFHVEGLDPTTYAARPRLISTLSTAISDGQEIEIEERAEDGQPAVRRRLQPHCLVIHPPRVKLLAFPSGASNASPVFIDLEQIDKVEPCDTTFPRRTVDTAAIVRDKAI